MGINEKMLVPVMELTHELQTRKDAPRYGFSAIEEFIDNVFKIVNVLTHGEEYVLLWAGSAFADKSTRIIIEGIRAAYPEHSHRIHSNHYMEKDAILLFDTIACKEEFEQSEILGKPL